MPLTGCYLMLGRIVSIFVWIKIKDSSYDLRQMYELLFKTNGVNLRPISS